jgi:hypothetical protein
MITLKEELDKPTPNTLADKLAAVKIGTVIRATKNSLYKQTPAASLSQLATLWSVSLPTDVKAAQAVGAYARAGAVTGQLVPVAYGVTPASGQFAVAPNGDIVTLAADAITSLDVQYMPEKLDVLTLDLPVIADVAVLPEVALTPGTVLLMKAVVTAGASVGEKIVIAAGGAPAGAAQANLAIDKASVQFKAGEATKCTVTLGCIPSVDVEALLGSASQYL